MPREPVLALALRAAARLDHAPRKEEPTTDVLPWPPSRGRDGVLEHPDIIYGSVGRRVRLVGSSRLGVVEAVSYETATGNVHADIRLDDGRHEKVWPEDLEFES